MTLNTLLDNMHFGFDDWSKWFWMFVGIAIAGLLGWVVRGVLGFSARPSVEVGRPAKVTESIELRGDQLEAVEGIGPTYAALLRKHDVHRFEQLAATDVATLQGWLKELGAASGLARPLSWPIQAALLANGQYEDFAKAVSLLKVGVVAPDVLPGIGETTQTQLAEVDVSSVESLAAITATELVARLASAGHNVSAKQAQGWIDAATAMLAGSTMPLLAHLGIAPESLVTRYAGQPFGNATRSVEGGLENHLFVTDAKGFAGLRAGPWWPLLLTGLGGMIAMVLLCLVFKTVCPEKCENLGTVVINFPNGPNRVIALGLSADGFFGTNSTVLLPEAIVKIDRRVAEIKSQLAENDSRVSYITVIGHADVRGSAKRNLELSKGRAKALSDYLGTLHLPGTPTIVNSPRYEHYGFGIEFPRSKDEDVAKGHAANKANSTTQKQALDEPLKLDRRADVFFVLADPVKDAGTAPPPPSSTAVITKAKR